MNKAASAVMLGGLGVVILWSGVSNAGILNTLHSLLQGQSPAPGSPQAPAKINIPGLGGITGASYNTGNTSGTGVVGNGSGSGSAIVAATSPYISGKYWWGGHVPTQDGGPGVDCYGLLTYVLHNRLGYNLPNNTHSGYLEFLAWSGATVVGQFANANSVNTSILQPGDLILWPSHSGISTGGNGMIGAENPSIGVVNTTIQRGAPNGIEPVTVKRVIGQSGGLVA
jgi:cell wall-associated NlpC family hydrolase